MEKVRGVMTEEHLLLLLNPELTPAQLVSMMELAMEDIEDEELQGEGMADEPDDQHPGVPTPM